MIEKLEEFMGISLRWLIVIVLLSALVGLFSAKLATTIEIKQPEDIQQNNSEYLKKLQEQYIQQKIVWKNDWHVDWGIWKRDTTRINF